MCVLTGDDWRILNRRGATVTPAFHVLEAAAEEQDAGGFEHFMLKEIHEQPEALENALRGRLDEGDGTAHFGGLNLDVQRLRQADRIVMTACGTSYHAALVGEYLFEEFARMPVEVEYASEFRYRNPPLDRNTIVLALTQSGETADTLAALRESKRKGHPTLGPVQRGRQQHRAGGRRRRLPARRPRDRRRQHQGVHESGRRPRHAGPLLRPDAPPVVAFRDRKWCGSCTRCRT